MQVLDRVLGHCTFNDPSFVAEFAAMAHVLNPKRVLEVGCLSGELLAAALVTVPDCRGWGIDPAGVQRARAMLQRAGVADRAILVPDSLEQFRAPRGGFDLVYSSGLLEHVPEEQAVAMLRSMGRMGKRVLTFVPYTHCQAYRAAKPKAPWRNERDYTPEELAAMHQAAGLQVEKSGLAAHRWATRFAPVEPTEPYLAWVLALGGRRSG